MALQADRQAIPVTDRAEWEYAARAGTTTRYWWGDELGSGHANCVDCGSEWDAQQTAPVGSFDANAFDLHDTAGNVFEWTCSAYEETFSGAHARCSAAASDGLRVLRGGSWNDGPGLMRSADRDRDTTGNAFGSVGFRLAQDL